MQSRLGINEQLRTLQHQDTVAITPLQGTLHRQSHPLIGYLKGVWKTVSEADNIPVPKWIFILFLTAVIGGGSTMFWRITDRLDEQKEASVRTAASTEALKDLMLEKVKPIERQGLLTEEHQRQAEIKHAADLAEIRGILKSRNIQ